MTHRFITLGLLAALLGLPVLTGCETRRERDDDGATIKVDDEGSTKGITVKDND